MNDIVLDEVAKLSIKYNKKKEFIIKMLESCKKIGYNFEDTKRCIEEFYTKV